MMKRESMKLRKPKTIQILPVDEGTAASVKSISDNPKRA